MERDPRQLIRSEMQTCLLTTRPKAKLVLRLLDCPSWPCRGPVHLMRRKTQRLHGGQPPSKPATRLLLQEAPLIYLQRRGVQAAAGARGGSSLTRPPWIPGLVRLRDKQTWVDSAALFALVHFTLKQALAPIPPLCVAAWAFHSNTQNNLSQKLRHKVRKTPGAPLAPSA